MRPAYLFSFLLSIVAVAALTDLNFEKLKIKNFQLKLSPTCGLAACQKAAKAMEKCGFDNSVGDISKCLCKYSDEEFFTPISNCICEDIGDGTNTAQDYRDVFCDEETLNATTLYVEGYGTTSSSPRLGSATRSTTGSTPTRTTTTIGDDAIHLRVNFFNPLYFLVMFFI